MFYFLFFIFQSKSKVVGDKNLKVKSVSSIPLTFKSPTQAKSWLRISFTNAILDKIIKKIHHKTIECLMWTTCLKIQSLIDKEEDVMLIIVDLM